MTPARQRALGVGGYVGAVRDDVVRLQQSVGAQMVATAVIVGGCKDKIDGPTMAQWDDLAKRSLAFSSAVVDQFGMFDAMMSQGSGLLLELNAWGPKLAALGCSNTPAPAPVPTQPPPSSGPLNPFASALADFSDVAKLALIAFVAYQFFGKR